MDKVEIMPLFTKRFLVGCMSEFDVLSIVNIENVKESVRDINEELVSGKILTLKEEEFKSCFVNTIFDDILGYRARNSHNWNLREEKKSTIDGTKPDAVLGYFYSDKNKDDVRAVIEIKSSGTSLDAVKREMGKASPVSQAFEYVPKSQGGNCKWVIVSNFEEIRFYSSLDRSRYQSYNLNDLLDDEKLNEIIFLFHKDNLIREDIRLNSATDKLLLRSKSFIGVDNKERHIIDKIYKSLKAFNGLRYVDPDYLASISPFNILDEHVWHYQDNTLFTLNPEICNLLREIEIVNHTIQLSEKLKKELANSNVIDALQKLDWSFRFLNNCLIFEIKAIEDYHSFKIRGRFVIGLSIRHIFSFRNESEGISKSIRLAIDNNCNCVSCTYRNLNFKDLIKRLNTSLLETNNYDLEIAYGHFLMGTRDYQSSYLSYKNIACNSKGKESKSVEYFISNLNISLLHNLIESCNEEDVKQKILSHIKSIDLDKVIYDDIDYHVNIKVKKYLLRIKEDKLFTSICNQVDDLLEEIKKLKDLYDNNGTMQFGPNLPGQLQQLYFKLYLHVNQNFIIHIGFYRHKEFVRKVFKGLLMCYSLPENGIDSLSDFFLMEAILHINPEKLKVLLESTSELKTNEGGVEILLERLENFTTSFFRNGFLSGNPIENTEVSTLLHNHLVRRKIGSIFNNLFTVLSRLDIKNDQFKGKALKIINFLKVENEFNWYELEQLGIFVEKKGYLFSVDELVELLRISINKENQGEVKYKELVSSIPKALKRYYSDYKLRDITLIQTLILKQSSHTGTNIRWWYVIDLCLICDETCTNILFAAFEQKLNNHFDRALYLKLIRNTSFGVSRGDYFEIYCKNQNVDRKQNFRHGTLKLTDDVFIAFIYDLYGSSIEFTDERVLSIKAKNSFEKWILNPFDYDYTKFNSLWLIDVNHPVILEKLREIIEIKEVIEADLRSSYNPILGEIKYKYFVSECEGIEPYNNKL